MKYVDDIHFLAPRGTKEKIRRVARRRSMTSSEWLRQVVLKAANLEWLPRVAHKAADDEDGKVEK